MATTDHRFPDQQLGKVNFNGLIMKLEKSLVFSDCSYLKRIFSKVILKFINDKPYSGWAILVKYRLREGGGE